MWVGHPRNLPLIQPDRTADWLNAERQTRRLSIFMRSFLLATFSLLVGGCGQPLKPLTPQLLKGATAAGGWWSGGCPDRPEDAHTRGNTPEALSPELTSRLTAQFPKGSDAAKVWTALSQIGFLEEPPCENDHNIKRATFRQSGGNVLTGPIPMFASVAWRVNALDKIEWTKGSVAYMGL